MIERVAWAFLAAFIIVGSAGTWAPYEPGIWAPTLVSPGDVARNVLLYVPFGLLGVWSLGGGYRAASRVIAIAVLFSLANEALQLYTIDRVGSLTDIVSAAAGASIGALAAAASRGAR